MRTLLAGLAVFVVTSLLAPVVVLARLLLPARRATEVSQRCMHAWSRSICAAAGVRLVVHGAEHVLSGRGVLYASNHVSWFDVFALAARLPRYTFVAKAELRRIPIFGWGAEGAGVVFLERENRKSAFEAYRVVAQRIADGLSAIVFPEGTRGQDYALRPFKKGPFVLAIAARAPVVPVVVYGAREVMPKGGFRVRAGTVHIHLLEPVEASGYDYEHRHDLMRAVWQRMAECLRHRHGIGSSGDAVAPVIERSA